jgi:ubiquinone/menaquinone biosynthesis C-methylase UbiE
MSGHVCPWWGGYFIDNRLRRLIHDPHKILSPYVSAGTVALDVGCGMGMFSIAMAQLAGPTGKVLAVDLQPRMLAVLAQRAARAGVGERITCHLCEPNSLNVTAPCDFALCFYSVHEIPDLRHLLEQIHSVLRPTGQLLAVEPKGHVPARQFDRMLSEAAEVGFVKRQQPPVRWSRAVLWNKLPL